MSFYNTTNESGPLLRWYEDQAESQEQIILNFFSQNKGVYAPTDVHFCVLSSAPITSVRRAITNLTKQGKLVKTDTKKKGPYGKSSYTWTLA